MNALLLSIAIFSQAEMSCGQLRTYVEAYGKEFVIAEAMRRGYSEAQVREFLRKCGVK